jgi:glycosyltransferase involved in cell wall biosynthesis
LIRKGYSITCYVPLKECNEINNLKSLGVVIRDIKLDRTGMNPIKDLNLIISLIRLLKNDTPDIVLNYTIKPTIYGSLAAKISGIKDIYSVITGLGYSFYKETFKQRVINLFVKDMLRISLRLNKKVFFLNQDDKNLFSELKITHKAITTVINGSGIVLSGEGIPLELYEVNRPKVEPVTFLMAARFYKEKGILEYLKACQILKSKGLKARFLLAGAPDSNPRSFSENEIRQIALKSNVEVLGWVDDIRSVIKDSSVFVLPSYREGLPRSSLEAMAMGRPIITTDAPGCRETVINGLNGYLVPPKNEAALAAAMEKFILHPEIIEPMGRESRLLAEKKFDVKKINKIIMREIGLA